MRCMQAVATAFLLVSVMVSIVLAAWPGPLRERCVCGCMAVGGLVVLAWGLS
jgi:hypothetical protein